MEAKTTPDPSEVCAAVISHRITPSAALVSFTAETASFIAAADADAVENALWEMWNALLEHATQTRPDDQGVLVELLGEVKRLGSNTTEFEVWGEKMTWGDLPTLGMVVRERYGLESESGGMRFVNLNAFAARLTAAGVLDLALYGIWTLRSVLEDNSAESVGAQAASAAVWFLYSGRTMWELCKKGETYEDRLATPGQYFEERDWRGYSEERWMVWVGRLENVSETKITGEEKALMEKAVAEIARIR